MSQYEYAIRQDGNTAFDTTGIFQRASSRVSPMIGKSSIISLTKKFSLSAFCNLCLDFRNEITNLTKVILCVLLRDVA